MTMLILTGFTLAPRDVHADIIYMMDNYASLQNGYTISGSITTDGTIGQLVTTSDLTSWDIIISQGATVISTFTSTNSVTIPTNITVTSATLSVAGGDDNLAFANFTSDSGIIWLGSGGVYEASANGVEIWRIDWNANAPIATASAVPEPSTAILAVFAAVSGVAYGWARKRHKYRRQGAA
jgi:hypothetical protein